MSLMPLKKSLNARDSLAFMLYVRMARGDEKPEGNEMINRFCKRTGIDRADYIAAVRHEEWPTILNILQKQGLLTSTG